MLKEITELFDNQKRIDKLFDKYIDMHSDLSMLSTLNKKKISDWHNKKSGTSFEPDSVKNIK